MANPVNDARDVAAALFFYAGHGVQHEGVNYLIPVTADINNEYELLDEAVSVDRVMDALDDAGAAFTMVVLDACRDNPFFRSRTTGSRGLAMVSGGGRGSLIAFATSPGDTASDGRGRNSPYTEAFLRHATTPGLEVSNMMRRVYGTVQELTKGEQRPWINAGYDGDFYLVRPDDQIARSEEAAKRLQAEQLAELAEAAEAALMQQRANERLREEMQREFSTQQVALRRQAEERRAELEELRRSGAFGAGLQERFTTLSRINAAIRDIDSRFQTMTERTLTEIDALHDRRRTALEEENPIDPWETPEEWGARLAGLRAAMAEETAAERTARRRELESSRAAELEPLITQRDTARADLNGRDFVLPAGAIRVAVRDFNPYEKRFPIVLTSTAEDTPFSASLSYDITSRDRTVLREEYYRVFSADRAGGLAGEFSYRVYELYPDVWAVVPHEARVVNLLEGDAVLAESPGGAEFLVHTDAESGRAEQWAGAVEVQARTAGSFRPEDDSTRLVHTREGNTLIVVPRRADLGRVSLRLENGKTMALPIGPGFNPPVRVSGGRSDAAGALLIVASMAPETRLEGVGGSRDFPRGGTARIPLSDLPDAITIRNRYIEKPLEIALERSATGTVWVDGAAVTQPTLGRVRLHGHDGPCIVVDAHGRMVWDARETARFATNNGGYSVPVRPGEYTVGYAGENDPYVAAAERVTVKLGATTALRLEAPPMSTRLELGRARAAHTRTEATLARGRTRRITGWSLIGAGVLSLGGSAYSYVQGTAARANYDDARHTATAEGYRADAARWGLTFSITAVAGALLDAGGVALLSAGPNRAQLNRQRNELERQIDALSARFAAETAQKPLLGTEFTPEADR